MRFYSLLLFTLITLGANGQCNNSREFFGIIFMNFPENYSELNFIYKGAINTAIKSGSSFFVFQSKITDALKSDDIKIYTPRNNYIVDSICKYEYKNKCMMAVYVGKSFNLFITSDRQLEMLVKYKETKKIIIEKNIDTPSIIDIGTNETKYFFAKICGFDYRYFINQNNKTPIVQSEKEIKKQLSFSGINDSEKNFISKFLKENFVNLNVKEITYTIKNK